LRHIYTNCSSLLFITLARIIWRLYRHTKKVNKLLSSEGSIGRDKFFRILLIGFIDILATLPLGLLNVIPSVIVLHQLKAPFYVGWEHNHANWKPISITYSQFLSLNICIVIEQFANTWSDTIMGLIIFALFGLTKDARATYRKGLSRLYESLCLRFSSRNNEPVSVVAFERREPRSDEATIRYATTSELV
jgi:hypothetical protein